MATCGCSVQAVGCKVGQQLAIDVWCGYELIESPRFPSLPLAERDVIWQQYHEVVEAYLRHCGYVDGEGQADGYANT